MSEFTRGVLMACIIMVFVQLFFLWVRDDTLKPYEDKLGLPTRYKETCIEIKKYSDILKGSHWEDYYFNFCSDLDVSERN